MYEHERVMARLDFVQRFKWNSEDAALLRSRTSEVSRCVFCLTATPPVERRETHRLFDYEDEVSGGFPLCDEHASEWVHESGPQPDWVSQEAKDAWVGPDGNGWQGLWFLFAPEGRYAKDGVWPYEEDPQDKHDREAAEQRDRECLRSRTVGPRHDPTGLECDLPKGHDGDHSAVFVDDYRITWKG